MTEQEAEALAQKLTRIWGITRVKKTGLARNERRGFHFSGSACDFSLGVHEEETGSFFFSLTRDIERTFRAKVFCDGQDIFGLHDYDLLKWENELQEQFTDQWLPFFRRGCWLSGCDIGASAHEKAEWMQDFSREEIEAWGLKP